MSTPVRLLRLPVCVADVGRQSSFPHQIGKLGEVRVRKIDPKVCFMIRASTSVTGEEVPYRMEASLFLSAPPVVFER